MERLMPYIMVNMLEGRTIEQKREFVKDVTEAGARHLGVAPQSITVVFNEVKEYNFAQAGVLRCDQK